MSAYFVPPGCKVDYHGVLLDREFRDEVLDLDKSKDTPEGIMNLYRYLRFCGLLFEQVACTTIDGQAVFRQVEQS